MELFGVINCRLLGDANLGPAIGPPCGANGPAAVGNFGLYAPNRPGGNIGLVGNDGTEYSVLTCTGEAKPSIPGVTPISLIFSSVLGKRGWYCSPRLLSAFALI